MAGWLQFQNWMIDWSTQKQFPITFLGSKCPSDPWWGERVQAAWQIEFSLLGNISLIMLDKLFWTEYRKFH